MISRAELALEITLLKYHLGTATDFSTIDSLFKEYFESIKLLLTPIEDGDDKDSIEFINFLIGQNKVEFVTMMLKNDELRTLLLHKMQTNKTLSDTLSSWLTKNNIDINGTNNLTQTLTTVTTDEKPQKRRAPEEDTVLQTKRSKTTTFEARLNMKLPPPLLTLFKKLPQESKVTLDFSQDFTETLKLKDLKDAIHKPNGDKLKAFEWYDPLYTTFIKNLKSANASIDKGPNDLIIKIWNKNEVLRNFMNGKNIDTKNISISKEELFKVSLLLFKKGYLNILKDIYKDCTKNDCTFDPPFIIKMSPSDYFELAKIAEPFASNCIFKQNEILFSKIYSIFGTNKTESSVKENKGVIVRTINVVNPGQQPRLLPREEPVSETPPSDFLTEKEYNIMFPNGDNYDPLSLITSFFNNDDDETISTTNSEPPTHEEEEREETKNTFS